MAILMMLFCMYSNAYCGLAFDVGIARITVTLGNYDQLKTEYYAQFLEKINLKEIKTYFVKQKAKEQLTAQDLEDLTNYTKLLELQLQDPYYKTERDNITIFLDKKKQEFEEKFSQGCDTKIKESDIFYIEKFLSDEMVFREEVTLDSILNKVNSYKTSDHFTFEDQQMARIKYELLDKKYNQGEKTEELKNQTLQALNNARSIAKKRQEDFLNKLNTLFASNDFNDCKYSTDFHDKLNSKKDELTNYKDLFDGCEHWASHHPQCRDVLKQFLEAAAENKKQTTNHLLTKDRTCKEKGKDVAIFYASIAALVVIFKQLKALNLEHHFAEWGREAATAVYNTSAGHSIANSQFAHNATHLASAVANSAQANAVTTGVNAVAHSPLVIGVTKVVVGLAGCIKSIPILPVVAAGVAGVLATGFYLRGMDYPEPENIQDIINKQGAKESLEAKNDITASRQQGQIASVVDDHQLHDNMSSSSGVSDEHMPSSSGVSDEHMPSSISRGVSQSLLVSRHYFQTITQS